MNILYYTGFFHQPLASAEGFDPALLAGTGTILTDRARLPEADAVVFHLPNLGSMQLPEKRADQIWIVLSVEAGANYPQQQDDDFMRQFDLRMLLRRDCELPLTYLRPSMLPSFSAAPRWKWRRTPAVHFGSNAATRSGRAQLLRELGNLLPIHRYGQTPGARHIRHDRGRQTRLRIISRYPFYLALENCDEADYVSEKVYDAFAAGTVPVYLGAPNVRDFLPAEKCAVFASDFESSEDLAAYLLELAGNRRRYEEFLAWRREPFSESFMRLVEEGSVPSLVRLHRKLVELRTGTSRAQLASPCS